MNKRYIQILSIVILSATLAFSFGLDKSLWGFFGHRKINRMAVFTLPPEMIGFFKKNIEYITEHSVDPDKRRYATKHEAVRHYIDVDHWGVYPFEEVPRTFRKALMNYSDILIINEKDTTVLYKAGSHDFREERVFENEHLIFDKASYDSLWRKKIYTQYYEDQMVLNYSEVEGAFSFKNKRRRKTQLHFVDRFSEYGILPYYLQTMKYRLQNAFEDRDESKILRLSAEFGHYIGDAHVPLHTTENYNGQFSDQLGIHAFWESRIPELFAEEDYDFFVGKADYIDNTGEYFWDIILKSHSHLDSLLSIEKDLSQTFPSDQIYCYEERSNRTIRQHCTEYAAEYQARMNGMVEERMRDAIKSIGSVWFTAWVDAGQPDLDFSRDQIAKTKEELEKEKELDDIFRSGTIKGRDHN